MTFVIINYGDNIKKLFNPNCQTKLLLENIKTRCQCSQEMEVELSDESGNLKNISLATDKYANQVLSVDRESLVLIQVKRDKNPNVLSSLSSSISNAEEVTYVPLLKNEEIITSKFTARLCNRDSSPSRSESRSRRPRERKEKSSRRGAEVTNSVSDKQEASSVSPTISSGKRNSSSKKRHSTPTRSKSRGKKKS